ncbi:uncharacterized protein LOC110827459 isoform X3 [Zootermopsis nevadensis]|uniref:uncharacterized protein LOC110827459 isoform X3 n=1 Tax=Zootermopsis nevadensis TaxID=136037 RepID=UPI000B8E8823|nr:uncharacterized protein LOC110827459 isoform X3 [Zootermopsis nevadensis]
MHAVKRAYGTVDVESVCRLCSSNSGIIVLNIFDGEGKKRRILSLINACLPVKVSENDPLPKVICHHCLHKLEVFHEFQESCLKSEETLRNGVTCTETFLEFKTDSQEYAHECEDTVSQFPTELLPVQDPFSPKQCTTAVTPPTERSEECTVAERRDVFENSPSGKVEVIMVKEEPDEKGTEVYEDKGWHHTSLVEDNMQTEQTEIDLLPLDDEVKSESCTTMDPPVISHSIFGQYSAWEDQVQENAHDMKKRYAKHGRPLGVPEEIRFSDVGSHLPDRLSSFRRCRFCSTATKQKRSRYQCSSCLVGLCITPCFKKFHEKGLDAT